MAAAESSAGPVLFEESDYAVYVSSSEGKVRLCHPEPTILKSLGTAQDGRVQHGVINFGSDIGRSEFVVEVDGREELRFEVEVFPSKLDYKSDYDAILAEVQSILTGLAFEYLRSTFQLGTAVRGERTTDLEWLILLKNVVGELERALRYVARHPVRRLDRTEVFSRVDRIRRVDSRIRSQVLRGGGAGPRVALGSGPALRSRLIETQVRATLDTPEHRWLAGQVTRILRRLAQLRAVTSAAPPTPRRDTALKELTGLEARIAALENLEPLAEADGHATPGFASLQLLSAAGYREAYRSCMVLALGLRIEAGPHRLSVKKLSQLYEYWCYLAAVRLINELSGSETDWRQLFDVRPNGLEVKLKAGRESQIRLKGPAGRKIRVRYNPLILGKPVLVPQKPDILIAIEDPGWPELNLVLDAKYRIDDSEKYVGQYGSAGPPEDALNVLHRYRDAILEWKAGGTHQAKRTVVQAAALFPLHSADFEKSRLWKSLEATGVGAIPLLPGTSRYLEEWIQAALRRGPWAMADRVVPHASEQQAEVHRQAASEAVLVGALRGENPKEHLEWIRTTRTYYTPLARTQARQFVARWVAIYSPAKLEPGSVVGNWAKVESVEVRRRGEVETPWKFQGPGDGLIAVYRLGELVPLVRPIPNSDVQRFGDRRWTSRLAVLRAKSLAELSLETEPEWRLYEALQAQRVEFRVAAGAVTPEAGEDQRGHARFIGGAWTARYAGGAGFEIVKGGPVPIYVPRAEDVLAVVAERGRGMADEASGP